MDEPRQARDPAPRGPRVTRRFRAPAAILVTLAGALAGGVGCGGDPAADGLLTVKVSGSPHLSVGPLLLADAEGYFEEQGIRIELLVLPGSTSEAVPALASGALDVITGRTNIGVFNAMANGAPIRIVASQARLMPDDCPTEGLMARGAVEPPRSPADLRGKRIAVNRMTLDGYYLDVLLSRAGLDLEDVEAITIPFSSVMEALNRGSVDLAAVPEPHMTHLASAGHVVFAAAKDVVPGLQTRSILYGPNFLTERPEAGRRFMIAYLQGVRRYNEGKTDRNLDFLAEEIGMERDLLERACWPSAPADGAVDLASLADFQAWAIRRGLLTRAATPDEMWEPRFLAEATAVLEPKIEP